MTRASERRTGAIQPPAPPREPEGPGNGPPPPSPPSRRVGLGVAGWVVVLYLGAFLLLLLTELGGMVWKLVR